MLLFGGQKVEIRPQGPCCQGKSRWGFSFAILGGVLLGRALFAFGPIIPALLALFGPRAALWADATIFAIPLENCRGLGLFGWAWPAEGF